MSNNFLFVDSLIFSHLWIIKELRFWKRENFIETNEVSFDNINILHYAKFDISKVERY